MSVTTLGYVDDKTLTTRLRAAAKRQGVLISKSRRRDPFAEGYGWLIDDPAAGVHLAGLTVEQVEAYLYRRQLPEV